ncbi:MAG: L,D-transpeptidase family protein [Anaeromicrobium sp.]|jgi:hypothetical protein|uniref:L,D-transpeptidase family protein n=1 Tax=Anaeromicrobium sp. TaxID=1929132 RepID=UPI0025FA9056|nr:L,D-transpeptidase family protein [Anaeromicrobium sp.]MCT4593429.1 L,D-transpeptidase family protein [Anaeromicrobium sp.]
MLGKLKGIICFSLIFILSLVQIQLLWSNEIYAQSNESPIEEKDKISCSSEHLKDLDEIYPKIDSIGFDKSNMELTGTTFRFKAICRGKNLIYQWTIFKDFDELYKKYYDEENFLDYTMDEVGTYQILLKIKDENGITTSKLSEEINIITPIKINSIWIDKSGKEPVNTPLTFSASAQGDSLRYHWYILKDRTVVYDSLLCDDDRVHYTPRNPGTYKAVLYVKDRFGKYTSKCSEEIIIYEEVLTEKEKLEALINERDFTSKTNYYIWINTKANVVYVFEGENKNWNLTKTMVCTDGKASTPTIKGNFTITGRALWLTSYNGKVRAKYKVKFFGHYYFHSVLFDSRGKNIVDSRLGQSLSHGCVRLSVDDAKWVYDNMNDGTGVYIY